MAAPLIIQMPVPPSANRLTRGKAGGRGKANSSAHIRWREEARWHADRAWREAGCPIIVAPVALHIRLGIGHQRDAGNCNKAIEDLLCLAIPNLPDDRWNDRILIERDQTLPKNVAEVAISSLGDTS